MSILGYGPVKEAAEAKAAKRREELLSLIRAGGAPMKAAAE
jgi:indolepyruvate ferredoxin oxidoreductase